MAKDDFFRLVFIILTELYEAKKQGSRINVEAISSKRFHISDSYWLDILSELQSEGYVRGLLIGKTKTGRIVSGLEDIDITMKGIEYLQENSKMKKVYEALKEAKDWVPFI